MYWICHCEFFILQGSLLLLPLLTLEYFTFIFIRSFFFFFIPISYFNLSNFLLLLFFIKLFLNFHQISSIYYWIDLNSIFIFIFIFLFLFIFLYFTSFLVFLIFLIIFYQVNLWYCWMYKALNIQFFISQAYFHQKQRLSFKNILSFKYLGLHSEAILFFFFYFLSYYSKLALVGHFSLKEFN